MVNTMQTVAAVLKKVRESRGLTYEKIYQDLRIHPRFLQALEESRYEVFSSPVHLKGFLKTYAEYLGLNVEQVLAFWRREYDEEKGVKRGLEGVTPLKSSLTITPGLIVFAFSVILVLAFFLYLAVAYRAFASPPLISLDNFPADIRTSSATLRVSGKIEREATLRINGQRLTLGESGQFAETLSLSPGVNVINFVAVNKLGKERQLTRTVVVEEGASLSPESSPAAVAASNNFELIIKIGPQAAWLEVTDKDTRVFNGLVLAGVSQTYHGNGPFKVQTGNGASTRVLLNGKDLGLLGDEGQVVYKIYP